MKPCDRCKEEEATLEWNDEYVSEKPEHHIVPYTYDFCNTCYNQQSFDRASLNAGDIACWGGKANV